MPVSRVKRLRRGGFQLRIPPPEREVLAAVPPMLRSLLATGDVSDPAMKRLFPAAFLDDERAAAEFDAVTRDDLLTQRLAAVDTLERTLQADRVTEDELTAWLGAVNDLRLVLGVRLGVTEESTAREFDQDPESERAYQLYGYLSFLEEDIVGALSAG